MTEYDIIHADDEVTERKFVEKCAQQSNLSYLGLSCLSALEMALPDNSARIFVVDGWFPKQDGDPIRFLASEAIKCIRSYFPEAKIVLYSSSYEIESIAEENMVYFRDKGKFTSRGLVEELKNILKG
jgi:hypothetical protein